MVKAVLITGGTKGIGKALTCQYLAAGFFVIVTYGTDDSAAEKAQKEFAEISATFMIHRLDMSSELAVDQLQQTLEIHEYEPLIVINNAGVLSQYPFLYDSVSTIESVMKNNFVSVVNTCKIFSKYMIFKKQGHIVNIASVAAHVGVPGLSLYSATKGAIVSYSKAISKELAPYNINVSIVSPGFIDTNMMHVLPQQKQKDLLQFIPMKRFGKPEEIAQFVVALTSLQSLYATGSEFVLDGGLTS